MALDFTVITSVRQRFGDESPNIGLEANAPFVGKQKDFEFLCPNVDAGQQAILLFQNQGIGIRTSLQINDQIVYGGVPASPEFVTELIGDNIAYFQFGQWSGNVMLVLPYVLKENNVLQVQAGDGDNFIIDNIVIVFKTRITRGPVS